MIPFDKQERLVTTAPLVGVAYVCLQLVRNEHDHNADIENRLRGRICLLTLHWLITNLMQHWGRDIPQVSHQTAGNPGNSKRIGMCTCLLLLAAAC